MLPYFRSYALVAYILGVSVPVLLVTAISWAFGFYIVSTLPGMLAAIILFIACLLSAKKIVTRICDDKAQKMISLYNDSCDPEAFLQAGGQVAKEIRPPYEENGAWFLSYYALALDDTGQRDEAARIGQAMLSSVQLANDPSQKLGMLISLEPLVQQLFGAQSALELIDQAEELLSNSVSADDEDRRKFLTWERGVLEAVRDGDDAALITRFSTIRNTPSYPLRVRVNDAVLEASIHKARRDTLRERECLQFAANYGNKLPSAALARTRLAELG